MSVIGLDSVYAKWLHNSGSSDEVSPLSPDNTIFLSVFQAQCKNILLLLRLFFNTVHKIVSVSQTSFFELSWT